MIGTKLAHYEVTSHIGSGGMGDVYQATDTKLGRSVAIKFLPEAFSHDTERVARFQREARVLASLNHPNIAAIHGVEEIESRHFLVMELVPGETLADRIKRGAIPIEEALPIAKQIAEALEEAHEKGIIHRDLKPANIKVTPDGKVKVLDFGLAKAYESGQANVALSNSPTISMAATNAGVILGTAAYMSPEQAKGKAVDKRADIWAFGVVLWEMLAGEQLFQGETMTDVLAAVVTKDPDLIRTPLKVRRLLRRCLEKDPKRRLRDIGEARFLLEEGEVDARAQQVKAPPRKAAWAIAAVLLLAFVAFAFVHFHENPSALQPLIRFSVDLGPEAVVGSRVTAAISPDGRRLAYSARGPNGKNQLATRLLNEASVTLLAGTENATDPFFSPDDQWIGFFTEDKMKKIAVSGGAAVNLCDASNGRGASWGEDGNIVAALSALNGGGLSRIPVGGGIPQALTKPGDRGELSHRWPQILPGGQAVLFTSTMVAGAYDDGSIEVLSLKTGQVKVVQQGGYFGRYLGTSNGTGQLVYVHQGALLGVPFDLDRLEVRGTPVPLLDDVAGDTATAGGQFDVSRNGTLVYLGGKSSTAAGWPLVWLDSTGKTAPLTASPAAYYAPRLSPDGKRLAVSMGLIAIAVYDSLRDTLTPLTFTPQNTTQYPVWAPDGKHIVFATAGSLNWIRSDGAGEPQQLLEGRNLKPYSFSPDGKRLAFSESRAETGDNDLWTLPLDLSDPERPKPGKPEVFLRTPADEYEPAFSPDGRWMAYRSNATGLSGVYVQPFPGGPSGSGGKWLISTGGGRHPVWSRNGRELFYQAPDFRIMVVTYSTKGDSFTADKPRPWTETQILEVNNLYWTMDLAPDGKRFVVAARPETAGGQKGSVHVTVLLNFFDELRRIAPPSKK